MTATPTHHAPDTDTDTDTDTDPETRYLELADLVDGLVTAMSRSWDDEEDATLLAALAAAAEEQASVTRLVHDPDRHAEQIVDDVDDARVAALLVDLVVARAHRRPRATGRLPELEQRPYLRAVLDCMAAPDDDQPGWVLALRLNTLIDHAISLGIGTRLAERVAHAVSHRPDGENAAEHEAAGDIEHDLKVVA